MKQPALRKTACWIALACLVVPMFASYFFDDMFSTISYLFEDPARTQLGWDAAGYGLYTSGYSVLCVFGGLVVCGILLDKWGVRVTGSIFVGMMAAGAALVLYAITAGFPPERSLSLAYVGCMFFGLGSEIAGTAVTRSIAKWFRHGPMALAMGLQLAIARLGTAFALVLAPRLVAERSGHVYTLAETARPAVFGLGLMAAGLILWAFFVAMDARYDRQHEIPGQARNDEKDGEAFRFADVLGVLKNGNFWLVSLLCVLFYSSIIAFKKFAGAILIPRFAIPAETAGWMVSMLPFSTVIFAPLFGMLVDRQGKGTRWMVLGSVLALAAHLLLGFELMVEYFQTVGAVDPQGRADVLERARAAVLEGLKEHTKTVKESDPVRVFVATMAELQASPMAFFAPYPNCVPPEDAIGYITGEHIYATPKKLFGAIRRLCADSGSPFPMDNQGELLRRLYEAGVATTDKAKSHRVPEALESIYCIKLNRAKLEELAETLADE